MQTKRIPLLWVVLALGACPLFAASPDTNIVLTLNGTLAFFNGTDCLSEGGATVTTTVTFSSAASPTHVSTRGTKVTYKLAPGTVTVAFSSGDIPSFTNTKAWQAVFTSRAQALQLSGGVPHRPGLEIYTYTKLKKGSWSDAILQHPVPFSPSPQNMKEPQSGWSYNKDIRPCGANFSWVGTASN